MEADRAVLIIGNFLSASIGGWGVCEDLSKRLAAAGWTVMTASTHPGRLLRLLDMAWTTWTKRNRYSVALGDVYSGPAFLWAEVVCWLLRRAGKKYVLVLRGGNLPSFARKRPARVRRLLSRSSVVVVPSKFLLEEMRCYREELYLLPNPIDLSAYQFRLRRGAQPKLVWARAFHSIYNPSLTPRVLSALEGDFPDVQITMVGPDKGDGSLQGMQRVAAELGVEGRITLTGSVRKPDVPVWISKSDIFLNTTNVDNMPVTLLEAMACGLCVVSTNVGGIPFLVDDGQNALLVSADDPEAMTEAVRQILTEPDLAERLSRNARKKVEQFDWAALFPKWESLLTTVVTGKPRTPWIVSEGRR
jgi:glycosyltransferase involved in cell wall biosynthesis